MNYAIGWIWPSGITLDWVRGREGPTVLAWTSSYSLLPPPPPPAAANFSPKEGILSMNKNPIGAINDGCLQIQVPDPVNGGRMFWSRQYYVVPLEVLSLSPSLPFPLVPDSPFPFVGWLRVPGSLCCRQNGIIARAGRRRKLQGKLRILKLPCLQDRYSRRCSRGYVTRNSIAILIRR